MALSAEDVVNWQLKTGMRGYLVPQVDELLDEVADELDRLAKRVAELEAEREAVRNSLEEQFEVEETLRRTLYQAQRAADQTVEDAKGEADRLRSEASAEAEQIVADARAQAAQIRAAASGEAEAERAEVRSRLQAQEARLRAVGSELRRNLIGLHELERETRQLLKGVHEDRLRELDRHLVELPDFDDALFATEGWLEDGASTTEVSAASLPAHDFRPPPHMAAQASEPDAPPVLIEEPEAVVEEPAADDEEAEAVVEQPVEAPEPELPTAADGADGTDDIVGVDVEPDGEAVDVPVEDLADAKAADLLATLRAAEQPSDGPKQTPAYLAAVSEALAQIKSNHSQDEAGRRKALLDDDLLDDVAVTHDEPAGEQPDLTDVMRPQADLFGEQAPRRRRRST